MSLLLAALVWLAPQLPFANPAPARLLAGSLHLAGAGALLAALWPPALALAAVGLTQASVVTPLLHPPTAKPLALSPGYLLFGDARYLGVAAQLLGALALARLVPRQGPVLGLLYLALPGALASLQAGGVRSLVGLAVLAGALVIRERRRG